MSCRLISRCPVVTHQILARVHGDGTIAVGDSEAFEVVDEVPTELISQERAEREASIAEGIRQTTIDLRIG